MKLHDNMVRYTPQPFDTSRAIVPDGIMELADDLAKNVHEVWATRRQSEGWQYGAARDDDRKEHPSLVPYGQLPDNEKDYDRYTALETIRYVLCHGYELIKKTDKNI